MTTEIDFGGKPWTMALVLLQLDKNHPTKLSVDEAEPFWR